MFESLISIFFHDNLYIAIVGTVIRYCEEARVFPTSP